MFPGQFANANQVARGIAGGLLTSDSTHYYRTFTSSQTLSITKGQMNSDIFIVGGGSGNQTGYGGASGQVLNSTKIISRSAGNNVVTIGAGTVGTTANNTSISDSGSTLTANGAQFYVSGNGFNPGIPAFSDPGGADAWAGGGGASSNGGNGFSYANFYGDSAAFGGGGGNGTSNPYSGPTSTPSRVAGGGGGAASDYWTGNVVRGFGQDGGGNGRSDGTGQASIPATNGTVNTGGGGGGGSTSTGENSIGGSGILIMRYSKNGAAG